MPAPLRERKILLVEDQLLIAMAIEDELLEHGATVLGPVATVKDALRLVAEQDFDAAVGLCRQPALGPT
jgi:DNA-binding response OmpR family regulator